MFDYITFDTSMINRADSYYKPEKTYTKISYGGVTNVLNNSYLFAVYRVDYDSAGDDIPSEFHVYGSQGEGVVSSAHPLDDEPKVKFEDSDMPFSLDFYGSFPTEAEAIEVMESAYPVGGCTDVNSANYDPSATLDDGTCMEKLDYTPYILVGGALLAVVLLV